MNTTYLADLLDQPRALRATLAQLHDWKHVQAIADKLASGSFRQEAFGPVLEILPIQMMPLAAARVRGHNAGEFARNTKVTETE